MEHQNYIHEEIWRNIEGMTGELKSCIMIDLIIWRLRQI